MKLYLIISYDKDEQQSFWDVIPAENREAANERWGAVRGDYADIVESGPLFEKDENAADSFETASLEWLTKSYLAITLDEAETDWSAVEGEAAISAPKGD